MNESGNSSIEHASAQERMEEFFEQRDPDFCMSIENYEFRNLKQLSIYRSSEPGLSFLIEMRFKTWKDAEACKSLMMFLRHPWYDTDIYKEDVFRISKSLFLRKML